MKSWEMRWPQIMTSVLISDTNERCAERKAEGRANVEAEIEVAEPKVKLLDPPEVRRGKEGFAHRSSGENIRLLVTHRSANSRLLASRMTQDSLSGEGESAYL